MKLKKFDSQSGISLVEVLIVLVILTEELSDSNEKPRSVEDKNNEPTANADTQSSLNKKSDEQQ